MITSDTSKTDQRADWRTQAGFALSELVVTVLILGIVTGVALVGWNGSRKTLTLKKAKEEIKATMARCYEIANQEGVDVYLVFWDSTPPSEPGDPDHPNQYCMYRVTPIGVSPVIDEMADDTPTEIPQPGVNYIADDAGHYWFKFDSGVSVAASASFRFQRQGTVVNVTEGSSVTINALGTSAVITVDELGDITF
ncbi:MAG: hypothetical protein A2Y75_05490 [Candidatus Solincola sediminis]|uniref:Prepilin-type N-terminal cleavage/methylation domain-containing protein n=1 Tax=Candidatus Solincola sediminis TaxID=1797199 RepID=A0A1F2WFL1_9ACTN|nr:MAG: hypothetical protein A2Y75_05490 [Candidatus Solincola sediminis]